jgi:murein DD-endopeptidase MepM/ murein hydrolase activator NlpD
VWRASALAAAAAALLAALPAEAGRKPEDALARQVADELAAIERARAAVGWKLAELDAARARRLAAAYRLLRAPLGGAAGAPDERMAAARRRAAVRLVLERELAERRLLAGEDARLRRTAAEKQAQAARVPELELPAEIGRPARGEIVRRFGTAHHEPSNTTLARRGVDLEVDARSPAVAPADGVVRYAGPIRGLDDGVIVDHGAFLTVIARLGTVSVPAGAPVRRGDRIGRAARRRVYLEVRVKLGAGGLPIDPEPLLPERKSREPR